MIPSFPHWVMNTTIISKRMLRCHQITDLCIQILSVYPEMLNLEMLYFLKTEIMPDSFYAGVNICGVYSEGWVILQYYENGEWWYWMVGVGTIPEHNLIKK